MDERFQALLDSLVEEHRHLADLLIQLDQQHLFEHWSEPDEDEEEKRLFFMQLSGIESSYPGGLVAYVENARKLLEASRRGANPFDGATPEIPKGSRLESGSKEFLESEALGLPHLRECAFVLVAGGLGERLGYGGIKIALPLSLCSERSFLQYYIERIMSYGGDAPLTLMTSDDTHSVTLAFLEENDYFGFPRKRLSLVKQEKVPSLSDNRAHFVCAPGNPYALETKPHGHGDVHALLHRAGLPERWLAAGRRWVIFFQDTNGLVFHALPAALGESIRHELAVNSLTVPRRAGEAAGAIVRLKYADGRVITNNVEYNQLDPLLRATVQPAGDVADESGYSPYPGNINALIFGLEAYARQLAIKKGAIPEFINPKYSNAEKTKFKKPTRLECMMQDYTLQLDDARGVGFTQFERHICFSAVKNNLPEAMAKAAANLPIESASSGEMDYYAQERWRLTRAGAVIEPAERRTIAGIPLDIGAFVALGPNYAPSLGTLLQRFKGGRITRSSVLIIEGPDILIEDLDLDGALIVQAVPGAKVHLRGIQVRNRGWKLTELEDGDVCPEELAIRGYRFEKLEERALIFEKPGNYLIEA